MLQDEPPVVDGQPKGSERLVQKDLHLASTLALDEHESAPVFREVLVLRGQADVGLRGSEVVAPGAYAVIAADDRSLVRVGAPGGGLARDPVDRAPLRGRRGREPGSAYLTSSAVPPEKGTQAWWRAGGRSGCSGARLPSSSWPPTPPFARPTRRSSSRPATRSPQGEL